MLDIDHMMPKKSSADHYLQSAFRFMFKDNFYAMYVFTNKEETGLDAYLRHSRQIPKDSYMHYKLHGVQLWGSLKLVLFHSFQILKQKPF